MSLDPDSGFLKYQSVKRSMISFYGLLALTVVSPIIRMIMIFTIFNASLAGCLGSLAFFLYMQEAISAQKASLSFNSVTIPDASVVKCIIQAKKNSVEVDNSSSLPNSLSNDDGNIDFSSLSCF